MPISLDNNDAKNHIDDDLFEEMRMLLADDFLELVQEYLDANFTAVEDLYDAFAAGDNHLGFEIAHKVKGASANLGVHKLMTLCGQMQDACRQDEIHTTASLIANIEKEIDVANFLISARLTH